MGQCAQCDNDIGERVYTSEGNGVGISVGMIGRVVKLGLIVLLVLAAVVFGAVVFGDGPSGIPAMSNLSIGDSGADDKPGEVVFEDSFIGGSDGINEMRVYENGTLRIDFQDDHDSDGFVILHDYHSDAADNGIVTGESPEFGGVIDLPFRDILASGNYPSASFTLEVRDGSFCPWDQPCVSLIGERHESVGFDVPESWIEESAGPEESDERNGDSIEFTG